MSKQLWKTLKDDLASAHGNHKWKIGKWYKVTGMPELCINGFHASERILDAMSYVAPAYIAQVEVRGKSVIECDKQCWSEMRVTQAWKWEKNDSVSLSIYVANLVLKNFEKKNPNDKRPRKAIEAARKWLKNPTEKNQSAARSAESAAESAESAAWSAAWSAAESAESAESAARSAAWSAAESAESAARSAAWSAESAKSAAIEKIEKWMKRRIKSLGVI